MPDEESWEGATPFRQLTWWICEPCDGEITEHRVIVDRHTRQPKQWSCTRCHTKTRLDFPFPPHESPDGREQIEAALKTLAIFAPIFMHMDQKRLYGITGRYFAAGWSVKDVLHAIDFRPDDSIHESAAVSPRLSGDTNLARVATRLREWVWRDRFEDEEGGDIMSGPITAMRNAQRIEHAEQQVRALGRDIEWAEQERLARDARERGAHHLARRQVMIAQALAKQQKREGDDREAAALAKQLDRARARSGFPSVAEIAATHWENGDSVHVDSERSS